MPTRVQALAYCRPRASTACPSLISQFQTQATVFPKASFSAASLNRTVLETVGAVILTVELSEPFVLPVIVACPIQQGGGTDLFVVENSVTFAPGETSKVGA